MEKTARFHPHIEDFRTPYARDRDRIIHTGYFRRLEYKTQVFLNTYGDYFRTRLTHSLEVSQIARTIARELNLNEDLAEAIALAHDLGHCPFGHRGGDKLDDLIKQAGFNHGFDHNYQSFRIVYKIEKRYEDFPGLNLCFATLEGLLKHSPPYKKTFISPEEARIFDIQADPSLEAKIVDLSDEIAYTSHDIDDGVKLNIINFDVLEDNKLASLIMKDLDAFNIKRNSNIYRYRFTSNIIKKLVNNLLNNHLTYTKEYEENLQHLKQLLFIKLYNHEIVQRKMNFGEYCMQTLFNDFMNNNKLLPIDIYDLIIKKIRPSHRVIADYLSSLTDNAAMSIYKELHIGQ